ncbi:MAG TPA: N-acetylmuramoyl-L-alanine amidase [Xanthobacteraceae bacterium]
MEGAWDSVRKRATSIAGAVLGLMLAAHFPAAAQAPVPAPAPPADNGDFPVASDVRVGGDGKDTRFVVDLTRTVDMRPFTLADPYRVVVDLPQVNFQFPAHAADHGRGLVKAFRYGLVMPGGSRIVLDTTGPVRVDKAFVLDATGSQPARLVLDLVPVSREAFLRAQAVDGRLARASAKPTEKASAPQPSADGDPRPVIVLDPGHGGIDSGTHARANGEAEKTLVLDFALMLREKLEKTGKYRVMLTRTDDSFVALTDRVRFARARNAQLFISIHCDALARGDGEAEGASVYTLSDHASDEEAGKLADAENRADVISGVDLSAEPDDIAGILIDLAQRETKTFSLQFAKDVVAALRGAARLHKHPLKSAGFKVLKAPDVPSVLIELGYVSNRDDLKELMSQNWRAHAGDAIVQAVDTYFSTRLAGGPGH